MIKKISIFLLLIVIFIPLIFIAVPSKKTRAQVIPLAACTDGLVSYWKGDDDALDSVGPNDGQFLDGTVNFAPGKVNSAFSFEGGYFFSDSADLPAGNSSRTLEFWVKGSNMALVNSFLAGWGNNSNTQMSAILLGWDQLPSRKFAFWGFGNDVVSETVLSDNDWHHLAMTYDGTTANIYHNGVIESNAFRPHLISLNTPVDADFIMAFNSHLESFAGGQRFHGLIDEVAVYNRALSEAELYQHYQNSLVGNSYCTIEVTIDIKPGSDTNPIDLMSNGDIPVAILTTENFDATTVDPLSVRFGPNGAAESHDQGHIEDVDGDGDLDLMLHFKRQETGIQCTDTSVSLTGETLDGQAIEGSDSVTITKC